jgi:hypothetical protein
MKEVLRNTLAAMSGALVGLLLISVIEMIGAQVYPPPAGLDPKDPVAMKQFLANLPVGALLFVLLAYFLGVLGGAFVAGRFSLGGGARQAVMVTLLFLVASVMNLMAFPHPAWFWAANILVVVAAGWLALQLLRRFAPAA